MLKRTGAAVAFGRALPIEPQGAGKRDACGRARGRDAADEIAQVCSR
jgi:hypothetical protein